MTAMVVLAGLSIAEKFIDHPLCKRLLKNWANKTVTKLDDALYCLLYGTPPQDIPVALERMQEHFDGMTPAEKSAAQTPAPMPWIEPSASE